MCEFAWKPGVRLGGSGFVNEGEETPYVAELDATVSGAGLMCGVDRWNLAGGAF